jgi:hypothetical protein
MFGGFPFGFDGGEEMPGGMPGMPGMRQKKNVENSKYYELL